MRKESVRFCDGVVSIFSLEPSAGRGNIPIKTTTPKCTLRYHERMVGLNRKTQFMQNNINVTRVLRCLRRIDVTTQDVAVTQDGRRYAIRQVQYPEKMTPLVMDITLEDIRQIQATKEAPP